jgi:hypothetical protein
VTPGVTIRIDGEISFPIAGLDSGVFDVLRTGDLVFPNPEHEKRVKRRLWLGDTPELITALEVYEGRAYFPRACLREVRRVLERECGIATAVERVPLPQLEPLAAPTVLELRDYQREAVEAGARRGGVIVLPPGSGKTIIGAGLASALDVPTLVIVHTKDLLEQWIDAFDKTLGFAAGRVGGGRKAQIKPITVAMIQTLVRWTGDKIRSFGDRFGLVIADEGHHCPASTYQRVIRECRAPWRIALTATPDRDDGRTPILYWTMGEIVYQLGHRPLVSDRRSAPCARRAIRSRKRRRYRVGSVFAAGKFRRSSYFPPMPPKATRSRTPISPVRSRSSSKARPIRSGWRSSPAISPKPRRPRKSSLTFRGLSRS